MAKTKTVYVCQNCGASSPKWTGKCPSCGEWNTYVEEIISKNPTPAGWQEASGVAKKTTSRPVAIPEIAYTTETRTATGDAELDRVLGGGIMPARWC